MASGDSRRLGLTEEALVEFGKNQIINSTTTLDDFAKSMITVVSGFFVAYFALIKFLGLGDLTASQIAATSSYTIAIPPLLFIISIMVFVCAYVPIKGKLSISNITSLMEYIHLQTKMKSILILVGFATFSIGLA
ncbi:MAG: hypothetical protein WBL44_01830, partial [Nitrososphaeraceae archaeon]